MKKIGILSASIVGAAIVGIGVGYGAIKAYQMISPVQKSNNQTKEVVEQTPVDPVKKIRQICDVPVAAPASKMYGNVSRELKGSTRQTTVFTAIARVAHTNPVVLDVDTASIKSNEDNGLFDEEVRKLPTVQYVVTDSAVHGLQYGDIIKASIEYSAPKNGEAIVNATSEDKEVAVKLQNSLPLTKTEKQGIFARNFVLFAMPSAGFMYMASGDLYVYGFGTDTKSGITSVKHEADEGNPEDMATKLSKLELYKSTAKTTTQQYAPTFCGYAYPSEAKPTKHDQGILSTINLSTFSKN